MRPKLLPLAGKKSVGLSRCLQCNRRRNPVLRVSPTKINPGLPCWFWFLNGYGSSGSHLSPRGLYLSNRPLSIALIVICLRKSHNRQPARTSLGISCISIMAAVPPSSWSTNHERGHSVHRTGDGERVSSHNMASIRDSEESRAPPTIPRAFEAMLKTRTETGDIGLFSFKPSRVPQPLNTPRRIGGTYGDSLSQKSRNFQPYGATGVDDRRRLPSYARDASSEVISMYETASQKSSNQMFDDPDYRSHSMTQAYSTYSLSNHRSYASLRSQPEGNALFQRPRSPFAYPTRLKRPGFRPSSPAQADGGGVDYSRRAEIERIPHVSSL
jgi:hypothetical protein